MDMILILQYVLSIFVLCAVIFGLSLLKKRLFQFSAQLSQKALRRRRML